MKEPQTLTAHLKTRVLSKENSFRPLVIRKPYRLNCPAATTPPIFWTLTT